MRRAGAGGFPWYRYPCSPRAGPPCRSRSPPARPFADDNGGWAAAGVVIVAGAWYGLIATGVLLVVLAIRAATGAASA